MLACHFLGGGKSWVPVPSSTTIIALAGHPRAAAMITASGARAVAMAKAVGLPLAPGAINTAHRGGAMAQILGTGVDLIEVERVRSALERERTGTRFRARVFTA